MGIFITFLLCAVLIFLIDFVELLRQSGKYGEVPPLMLALIALLRLPAYSEYLVGFAVLVGSIAALLQLSRRSELVVMRAGGMSVWQFLGPGLLVAFVLGTLAVTGLNPLAAAGAASRRASTQRRSARNPISCGRALRATRGCARTAPTASR